MFNLLSVMSSVMIITIYACNIPLVKLTLLIDNILITFFDAFIIGYAPYYLVHKDHFFLGIQREFIRQTRNVIVIKWFFLCNLT